MKYVFGIIIYFSISNLSAHGLKVDMGGITNKDTVQLTLDTLDKVVNCGKTLEMSKSKTKCLKEITLLRKNSVYAEILGLGLLYSISYERLISLTDKNHIGLRGGVEVLPVGVIPVFEAKYIHGGSNHFFELGFGGTLFSKTGSIGYRYQADNGFLFRVTAMYMDEKYLGDFPWGGVSFGYSF